MAYNSKDIQEVVTVFDVGGDNQLRISTIKDKDTKELKSIDLRTWYLAENGSMQPTKKGVRIKQENLADAITSILLNCGYEVITDIRCNSGIDIDLPEDSDDDSDDITDDPDDFYDEV